MNYKPDFLKDLKTINEKIRKGDILGAGNALELFKDYLPKVKDLGRFSPQEWKGTWREEVYLFGEYFKTIDPIDFLMVIKDTRNGLTKDQEEVLDFFKSEIKVNNQPFEDCKMEINEIIQKYPYNPEFRHNLGHFFNAQGKLLEAIEQYEFALKRDNDCQIFLKNLFNCQYQYIEEYIDKEEYSKGLTYCDQILNKGTYNSSYVFKNLLVSLKERLKDYLTFESKIKNAEEAFKTTVRNETEKERKRLIEILGFFSAIIAFIFSTVSIAQNFKFEEALIFIVCLGLILLIFMISINILFSSERLKYSHPKLLILVLLMSSLILVLIKYTVPLWIQ